MDIHSRSIRVYRWAVLLMAAAYAAHQFLTGDYSQVGGPLRFLTIWALLLSLYSASRMLAITEGRITRRHEVTAMCAAVLNVMVVFLYWRLFFEDPNLVNSNGHIPFLEQYYLHGLGPALQIFDAVFIAGAFNRIWRAAAPLVALVAVYVAWAELILQRFNTFPAGSVTSGLPYPFLNAMEWPNRMAYYASNAAVALAILAALGAVSFAARRLSHPR